MNGSCVEVGMGGITTHMNCRVIYRKSNKNSSSVRINTSNVFERIIAKSGFLCLDNTSTVSEKIKCISKDKY